MKKIYCLVLLMFSFTKSSLAFTVNHEFDVFIGKFNASRTNFSYTINDLGYTINSDVKTYGFFDTLYPFKATYFTEGKILKNRKLRTSVYKYSSKSRFTRRTKELVYNDDGVPVYRLTSKNDDKKKVDIKDTTAGKGTTDLQTVIATLVLQYNKVRFCDARMEVFDGKRRFDVIFRDEGQDNIKANKYSKFEGEATKCSMYIDSLGSKGDDLLWEITSDQPVYFWIMEQEENRPFIARVEVKDTAYGRIIVYTKNIEVKE